MEFFYVMFVFSFWKGCNIQNIFILFYSNCSFSFLPCRACGCTAMQQAKYTYSVDDKQSKSLFLEAIVKLRKQQIHDRDFKVWSKWRTVKRKVDLRRYELFLTPGRSTLSHHREYNTVINQVGTHVAFTTIRAKVERVNSPTVINSCLDCSINNILATSVMASLVSKKLIMEKLNLLIHSCYSSRLPTDSASRASEESLKDSCEFLLLSYLTKWRMQQQQVLFSVQLKLTAGGRLCDMFKNKNSPKLKNASFTVI